MVNNKQNFTQHAEKYFADWNEVHSIKQWREENKIEVNSEFLRKVNKADQMKTEFWMYVSCFAFAIGLIIGVTI